MVGGRVARSLRMVLGFAWLNGIVAAKRNPLWVISYLVTPLSLLVLFYVWGGIEFARNAVIGGLISMATMNGIGLMGDVAYYKNFIKLQDMMVASPMGAFQYMMGLALSGLLFSLPGLLLMLALLLNLTDITLCGFIILILAYVLLLLSMAGIGFTLSTYVKEERYVWPLSTILSFALTILPPVYYPYDLLPTIASGLALVIPSSNAAMVAQYLAGVVEETPTHLAMMMLIMAAESVLFLWISINKSQWREK